MYGSDMTEHSCNHRFRPIRAQAKLLQKAVNEGQDAKDIPVDVANDAKGTPLVRRGVLLLLSLLVACCSQLLSSPC